MSYMVRTDTAPAPVSLADMKVYLKISDTSEDDLISAMIEAATLHAEAYCSRDLRENSYEWLTTGFGSIDIVDFPYRVSPYNFRPISQQTLHVERATVGTIDAVDYLLDGSWTNVPETVWYSSVRLNRTYLIEKAGQGWPSDADCVEDNIRITFTMAIPESIALAVAGIMRHVARMYEERGDCEPQMAGALANQTAKSSGAEGMYQSLQIPGL